MLCCICDLISHDGNRKMCRDRTPKFQYKRGAVLAEKQTIETKRRLLEVRHRLKVVLGGVVGVVVRRVVPSSPTGGLAD